MIELYFWFLFLNVFFSTGNGAQNVWSLFGTGIHRQIPIGRFRFLGDRPTVAEIVFASLRTETAAATTESHRSRLVFFSSDESFFLRRTTFLWLFDSRRIDGRDWRWIQHLEPRQHLRATVDAVDGSCFNGRRTEREPTGERGSAGIHSPRMETTGACLRQVIPQRPLFCLERHFLLSLFLQDPLAHLRHHHNRSYVYCAHLVTVRSIVVKSWFMKKMLFRMLFSAIFFSPALVDIAFYIYCMFL